MFGVNYADAQDLSRMTARDMLLKIRTMNVDQMNQIVRNMDRETMTRVLQNMDSYTISQLVRSLDPNTMSEIAKRFLAEFSKTRPNSVTTTTIARESNQAPTTNPRSEIASGPPPADEQQNRTPAVQVPDDAQEEQIDLSGISVIANPANPVNELTHDQIHKIYTGEYSNWSQVGGPDLAIKVMTLEEGPDVRIKVTPSASVSVFSSSVFAGVAGTRGALGFVPHMQSRQLRFIVAHDAIKTMAIKFDAPHQVAGTAQADSATPLADLFLAYQR